MKEKRLNHYLSKCLERKLDLGFRNIFLICFVFLLFEASIIHYTLYGTLLFFFFKYIFVYFQNYTFFPLLEMENKMIISVRAN